MQSRQLFLIILTIIFIDNFKNAYSLSFNYGSGIYAGFFLGYSQLKAKNAEKMFLPPFDDHILEKTRTNLGIGGDVFLGKRYMFMEKVLTGVDLALSWDSNNLKYNNNFSGILTQTEINTPYKFIPGIIIGYSFLDKFLMFTKLGATFTEFRGKHTTSFFGASPVTEIFRKRKTGFYGAINIESAIKAQLSMVISFAYENYGKLNKTNYRISGLVIGEENEISLRPSCFSTKIGFIFHFN